MPRAGRESRFVTKAFLLCLCLLCAAIPARADENARVEALRQLYRELNLTELPDEARCENGDACGHVYIDADGQVKALCPFGSYMLGFDQARLKATLPIDLALQPGDNPIDRGTTYHLTGGYSNTTVTVAQLRSVSLDLDGAVINELILSAGSTTAVSVMGSARVGMVKPVGATLNAVGALSFDQIGESAGTPGALTVTGSGTVAVGTLYSVLSRLSSGGVVLRAGTLSLPAAVANWEALTLASGSFDGVTALRYNDVAYPLCVPNGTNVTTGYSPLPVLEPGDTYKAAISGADPTVCLITLVPAPTEYTIQKMPGRLTLPNKCVLKSVKDATQSVEIASNGVIEMVSAQTSGGLSVAPGMAGKARLNGANRFGGLTVPASASLTLSGGGSISLGSVTNEGALTIPNCPGAISMDALTGGGTVSLGEQTNVSIPGVVSLNNGSLWPTRIQIVETGSDPDKVKNTKIQLKLGTGEMFTTTTDGNGMVTLWRPTKLTQVDVVALSGSDTYTAVIQSGSAEADALPIIQSVTLDKQGNVTILATGAKSYGVQYIIGSLTADVKDAFDSAAQRVEAPGGKCAIPGLGKGDRITIRAYAAKDAGATLTAATSDAFAFSSKQGIEVTPKIDFVLGKRTKTYDGIDVVSDRRTLAPKLLPTKHAPIEFWHNGVKLKSAPVNEGQYTAVIKVLPEDPVYLPKEYKVEVEITRKRILVYAEGTKKVKYEEDPYVPFETESLIGMDMVMGYISRTKGESYGNHAYSAEHVYAVDENGERVSHYHFVLAPSSGCLFIDWNFRHFISVDPLSYIDPVYEEAHFSDGLYLRVQYRTSEVLKLGGTYMGTLVRDSDTRRARPYTPSLRVRRGYDEALLILTADAEFRKDGGYETDRDGNRVWRGRVLSLSYWQLNQLQKRHIQYIALSLKGTALMASLGDLTSPEMEALIAANGLKKTGLRFNFELIPTLGPDALEAGEGAAKPLFAGRSSLTRMAAYLEYEGRRVDMTAALPNAWLLFDAAALLEEGDASASSANSDITETVNGRPVTAAENETELSPEERAAVRNMLKNGDTTEQQRELAYVLLERAVIRNGGGLQRFRENGSDALDSDIVVPYTASETRIMEFAALMRTRPFFIASFRQNGLYGLNVI